MPVPDGEAVFRAVSVGGHPPVEVCLPTGGSDPVVPWLLDHDWIDEPVMRLFGELVEPGMRVLDLGAHLGLFSLTAARLGARVLAVDAVPAHVECVRASAARNGFEDFAVVLGAVAARSGERLPFVAQSIHSHVLTEGEDAQDAIEVPGVAVDDLLGAHGWDGVDLVKMDIEGSEVAALAGMARLFARGGRPVFVFEGNGGMLPAYGHDPARLRSRLARRGYPLFQIDHLRPGTLVAAGPIQPECVVDYLAGPPPAGWTVTPPFTREQIAARLLDQAASDGAGYRAYVARQLAGAPAWLAGDPLVGPAVRALQDDVDGGVREVVEPLPAARGRARDEPLDDDLAVVARGLTVAARRDVLPHAPGQPRDRAEALLRDVSLHVRRGTHVGICGGTVSERHGLLATLAGRIAPLAGTLSVRVRPQLLSAPTDLLEPGLTVRENVIAAGGTGDALLERIGADPETILHDQPAAVALDLALAVTLEHGRHELLLLGDLVADARPWVAERLGALRAGGVAVVTSAPTPAGLPGAVDRLVYLRGGTVRAAGHPGSVADLALRHELGLADHAPEPARPWLRLAT